MSSNSTIEASLC